MSLVATSAGVLTDSGGVQEETTYLSIPCFTLRENTERPVTVTLGTNTLVGRDLDALRNGLELVLAGAHKAWRVPPLWDGHAAERIAAIIVSDLETNSDREARVAAQPTGQ